MNPSISPERKRDINIHAIVNLRKKSTYSGREHLKIVARKTMNHQWIKTRDQVYGEKTTESEGI